MHDMDEQVQRMIRSDLVLVIIIRPGVIPSSKTIDKRSIVVSCLSKKNLTGSTGSQRDQ